MVNNDRVRIFDRQGLQIAEFRASVVRSWVIGNEGRASFTLSNLDTRNVDEDIINPGNWLYVQCKDLPDWVGVIDFPREWNTRKVNVYAFSPERVFAWRRGPIEQKVTGSAGEIFTEYIKIVNKAETTIIRVGNIVSSAQQHERTLNPVNMRDELRKLYETTGEEYTWRAITDINGRLIVYGDWTQRLGTDTNLLLQEGKGGGNIEATEQPMVENEPMFNDVLGYGDGMTWQKKPTSTQTNDKSIAKYGLRQTAIEFRGVSVQGTLDNKARAKVNSLSSPSKIFDVIALDPDGSKVFPYLRQGNTMRLRMQSVGFVNGAIGTETNVRIVGMGYDPAAGAKMPLILNEVK